MLNPTLLYILYSIASVILAYRLIKLTSTPRLAFFALMLIVSALLFHYENTNVALLLSGVIIFSAIISSYGTRLCYLFILVGLLYASLAYTIGAAFMLQSLLLGMLSGSHVSTEKKRYMHKGNELSRNMVQIAAGIFFIAVFYLLSQDIADAVLFWVVVIGSLLGNYALRRSSGSLAKLLYSLERRDTLLGSGARWLAMGSLLAAGFLTRDMVIVVFSAIFLADSFSTLVGIEISTPKLPYNGRKSLGGTLAYFFTVLIVSYLFIGPMAVVLAAIAAFSESQPFHIDDNFDVSLVMVVLIILMAHFGLL